MLKRYILKQNVTFKNEVVGGYNFVTFTLSANNMAEAHAKAMRESKTDDIVVIEFALNNIMNRDERYLNPNL
jgi:cobalamin biosynthesis protein CobD/CbiB